MTRCEPTASADADRPEHVELALEVEPVAGLDLDRRRAVLEHPAHVAGDLFGQRVEPGGARGLDRREDAAAGRVDLLVGGAVGAPVELVDPVAGEARVRVAVDEPGDRDHPLRVDDHRVVAQLEPGPELEPVPDRHDLAVVRGDPDIALEHLDVAERGAAQRRIALSAGARALREPADHQVGVDRLGAHAPGSYERPYTGMTAPDVSRAAGEHSQRIVSANSSGVTQRDGSASGEAARFAGVSMTLGSTQLTLTPWSRTSTASAVRERDHRALRGAVRHATGERVQGGLRADEHDRPTATLEHQRKQRAAREKRRRGVQIEQAPPGRERRLGDARPGLEPARAADERVTASVALADELGEPQHRLLVEEVDRLDRQALVHLAVHRAARRRDDACARRQEGARDGAAETAGPARHHGHVPFEAHRGERYRRSTSARGSNRAVLSAQGTRTRGASAARSESAPARSRATGCRHTWSAPASRCSRTRSAIAVASPQTTSSSTRRSLPPSAKSASSNPSSRQLLT